MGTKTVFVLYVLGVISIFGTGAFLALAVNGFDGMTKNALVAFFSAATLIVLARWFQNSEEEQLRSPVIDRGEFVGFTD